MKTTNDRGGGGLGRRGFLALSGVGLAAAWRPGAVSAAGSPGSARASTRIVDAGIDQAIFATGPLPEVRAPAGSRLGLCLMIGGAEQRGGRLPLVQRIGNASLSVTGLAAFEPDPGVERAVYRLLDGLDTVRPVELFGLAARVGENGIGGDGPLDVTWEATLRGDDGRGFSLGAHLRAFHAVAIGELAASSKFVSLTYTEVSRDEAAAG